MFRGPDSLSIDGTPFHVYRERFPFGDYTGYRTSGDSPWFRFWADGRAMTPGEFADYLDGETFQVSESGIWQAMTRYAEVRALRA